MTRPVTMSPPPVRERGKTLTVYRPTPAFARYQRSLDWALPTMTPCRGGTHPTHRCKLAIQIKTTILRPGHQFRRLPGGLTTLVLGNESEIPPLWLAPHRAA